MNILDGSVREKMDDHAENEDIKVEVEHVNGVRPYTEHTNNQVTDSTTVSSEYSPRYPYPDEVLPPVYMSTIAKSSAVSAATYQLNENRMKYVNSGCHREYQNSPPNIDKAPSFVSRVHARNGELENHNATPPSPSTTPPEDKHVWSKAEVELLLDMYETYKEQLKDPRVRKTKVWEDVARVLQERLDSDVNGCQCNQKFRNLKADFQKVMEHNGRPGNFKRVCKYYDRLANLLNFTISPMSYHGSHNSYNDVLDGTDISRPQPPIRDLYFENGHSSPSNKIFQKRKIHDHLNELQNGHVDPYYSSKKSRLTCNCECSHELANLRESIERVNSYVAARVTHEEEKIRRLEEMHREKLIALGRFVDIFKDFIHKMS